jgi:hypothetical protein
MTSYHDIITSIDRCRSLDSLLLWEGYNKKGIEFKGREAMKEWINEQMNKEKTKRRVQKSSLKNRDMPPPPTTTGSPVKNTSPGKSRLWSSPPEKRNKSTPATKQVIFLHFFRKIEIYQKFSHIRKNKKYGVVKCIFVCIFCAAIASVHAVLPHENLSLRLCHKIRTG